MSHSLDQARAAFQGELDSVPPGGALDLMPCEFPGPFTINQSLTIDGHGATLWALQGPVLEVLADRVTLRNLRIEVTGGNESGRPEDECALRVHSTRGLLLENVEVRGSVIGLPDEEGTWRYPFSVHVGQLAHGREHELLLRLAVPVPCRISSNISGLELDPYNLRPGPNEVRIRIERMAQDTLLNGTLCLASAFLKRSLLFSAHIVPLPGIPVPRTPPIIWEPPDWASLASSAAPAPVAPAPPPRTSVRVQPPPQPVAPAPPPPPPPPPAPEAAPPPAPLAPPPVSLPPVLSSPRVRRTTGKPLLSGAFSPPAATTAAPPPADSGTAPPAAPAAAAGPGTGEASAAPPELPPLSSTRRSVPMKPLSSLFTQQPEAPAAEAKEEPPPSEPADGTPATPTSPASRTRKITRAPNISPLFGGGAKKPDEEKSS